MNIFDFFNRAYISLTAQIPVVTPSNGSAVVDAAEEVVEDTGGLLSSLWPILMWGAVIVVLYFVMFRGPKKEQKKKLEMRNSIKVGDSIMTNAGLFGKVVEIGADSFIVEFGTNKGVRIPVVKEAVECVREPALMTTAVSEDKK